MISASKFLELIQDENNVVAIEGLLITRIEISENKVFFFVEEEYYDYDGEECEGFVYTIGAEMVIRDKSLMVQLSEITTYPGSFSAKVVIAKKITF